MGSLTSLLRGSLADLLSTVSVAAPRLHPVGIPAKVAAEDVSRAMVAVHLGSLPVGKPSKSAGEEVLHSQSAPKRGALGSRLQPACRRSHPPCGRC